MRPLNKAKKEKKWLYRTYFKMQCPDCHEWFVFDFSDVKEHTVLFEPKEREYEYFKMSDKKLIPYIGKEIVSSVPDKDLITLICPVCGKEHTFERKEYEEKRILCNYFGEEDYKFFELEGKSYEKAKAFREKHRHKEEFEAQGKMGFTALGQQFSYTFTPGGFGAGIVIKCNYCGETENITDTENW